MRIMLIIAAVGSLAVSYPPESSAPPATTDRGRARIDDGPTTNPATSTLRVASSLVGDEDNRSAPPTRGDATLSQRTHGPSPVISSVPDTKTATLVTFEPIVAATRGVIGGKHDFSKLTGKPFDACGACHAPHVVTVRPTVEPNGQTALRFFHLDGERQSLMPGRYTPGPSSLICLTCHNGTVASSTIGSSHAMLAGADGGLDVPTVGAGRDHPIGIEYPGGAKGFRPQAMVVAEGSIRLPDGRLECVSCHDPHNVAGIDNMLVKSNKRSALCLSCHVK